MKQKGFFDETDRLEELSRLGDPLEKLNQYMKWEELRGILTRALKKEPSGLGGRPPFDYGHARIAATEFPLWCLGKDTTRYSGGA
jgi:hypothetical protein